MIPVVILSLVAAFVGLFLIAVTIFITIFFRAGFRGEQDMAEEAKAALDWQPPFVDGEALRNWTATNAEQLAQVRLTGRRIGKAVVQLAMDLEDRAVLAMLPRARQAELERIVTCPETGQGMIGLTAPEALAISAQLRNNQSRAEQKRIYQLAMENCSKIGQGPRAADDLPPLTCPLLGQDQVCSVYAARPLRCRAQHAVSVARSMSSRRARNAGSLAEALGENQHERTVAQGIEIGLTRALNSAGLDANVYELNSILAKALETPDAAERWAKGENLFSPCQRSFRSANDSHG